MIEVLYPAIFVIIGAIPTVFIFLAASEAVQENAKLPVLLGALVTFIGMWPLAHSLDYGLLYVTSFIGGDIAILGIWAAEAIQQTQKRKE